MHIVRVVRESAVIFINIGLNIFTDLHEFNPLLITKSDFCKAVPLYICKYVCVYGCATH
jgi:hypothetical protein